MDPFLTFEAEVSSAFAKLQKKHGFPEDIDLKGVKVELPRDPSHGDLSTNAAMVLAKKVKLKPRDLADLFVGAFQDIEIVQEASAAGPGFVNLTLSDQFWQAQLRPILEAKVRFGFVANASGEKVNVEYVSANPTGPMHVGHCRGAVFGDALANLLDAAGYDVTREYYINDAGAQVDQLARSAHLRYREALGEKIGDIPEGLYPGDYLIPVGQALAEKHGAAFLECSEDEWMPAVRDFAIDRMMDMIRDDLRALGIEQEVFFSERDLQKANGPSSNRSALDAALHKLTSDGLIYQGVLEPPKGKKPDDWEEREQTLFRATDFGDDTDRPLLKSDGSYTYFASDIAYHNNKFERGFAEMIDVWGADHAGYIKRMQAAVKAITGGRGTLDVKICQLVRLFRDGEPVKMSKRAGTFVTLREVVDEVGADVVRFIMLFRKNDAALDFDFAKVLEQSKDNPVFYVQYAHARVHSVLRMALETLAPEDIADDSIVNANVQKLTNVSEIALMKQMAAFPRLVQNAATTHEPHRIAFYLYELASEFHSLWNKGKDDPTLRFVIPQDKDVTLARLAMVRAVGWVIAAGLGILGVRPLEEMR